MMSDPMACSVAGAATGSATWIAARRTGNRRTRTTMGDKPISTVSDDQHEILRNIMALYSPEGFDLDPTYGSGGFYKNGVPIPALIGDVTPRNPDVAAMDCRNLPFKSATLGSIVFDPPFIHAMGKDSIIGQRFADERSQHSLRALYLAALVEFYRVLKPKGILVFKCQDIVESGKQVMNHCWIWQMATGLGFVEKDLFILVAKSRIIGHNHHEQQHARKLHSYFWVFEKGGRR